MKLTRRRFLQASAIAGAARPGAAYAANDQIQIGVIGAGARSHELMQALLELPGNKIVGVVDAYKGRVTRTKERVGNHVRAYSSYKELLADSSIDAVLVVTPDHWHHRIVLDAIAAGKDVYCEKPLTYRSSEGVEIARAAKKAGRIVQVGSQGMSGPIQRKAKAMIKEGKLGQVTMVRAAFNRNTASGAWIYPIPPDASPDTVDWEMFLGPAPKRAFDLKRFFRWRCYWDYSGGIATDLFVHLCTTIHFLLDAKAPAKVLAMGELYRWKQTHEVPDTLNAILEYPDGFVVNLSATFNNQVTAEGSFQFLGTEGTINLAREMTFIPENPIEDNRWIVESWPKALEEAYYKDPKVLETEVPSTWPAKAIGGVEQYHHQGRNTTVLHLGHFLESIRTRKPYWEDALAGHRAAACAHMINLSAKEHRVVEWDFAKDDIKA